MENLSNNNNQEIQNNIQAKISFRKDMKTLKMNLPGIDKSLKGYGYKYQNFNEIVEEIESVIYKHNLELDFEQYPISKFVDGQKEHVIRTTFYSTSTGYEFSFDTPMLTENLQWNNESGSKNVVNTVPQLVGSAITYFKRYALVACLHIKSEVDTDAAPIYNNHENENSMSNKQVSVNQKQEQKKDINQEKNQLNSFNKNLKSGKAYCYEIFRDALFNIKNWVNEGEEKNNINALIRALCTDNDDALEDLFEKNAELKSIEYWVNILKKYFNKTNRFDNLNKLKVFMSDNRDVYKTKVLKFFCMLKKERQFNYIFAV
ncbi:single-stranded DNA-binding protein [Borreliella burgdorferi]|uniref:ERF family protein n=2 Tax=Borreliella burgdorferi TaxID=139 RepID=UPI000D035198|nr:ERF family protein [Borreliella burgdorferi]PRR04724.1 single-stranded DNA-binding protein [Borreliella burgdorferi]PRR41514.1 single-stranded DNA-binding protein [Borreliella burgdorferi]PRR60246.1 single-stranded DNA-binding protein [Borreliella burgdorferi]PRR62979.1 single-stranded DNA-binding protein [Borreliella burgdorferi]PRR66662.1 single-stranded DNA-binding protein [Borreliella burgdorferi]